MKLFWANAPATYKIIAGSKAATFLFLCNMSLKQGSSDTCGKIGNVVVGAGTSVP